MHVCARVTRMHVRACTLTRVHGTHAHTCTHIHAHTCTHMHTYTCTHMHARNYACICVHVCLELAKVCSDGRAISSQEVIHDRRAHTNAQTRTCAQAGARNAAKSLDAFTAHVQLSHGRLCHCWRALQSKGGVCFFIACTHAERRTHTHIHTHTQTHTNTHTHTHTHTPHTHAYLKTLRVPFRRPHVCGMQLATCVACSSNVRGMQWQRAWYAESA